MKKSILFLVVTLVLSVLSTPIQAQSRKDKKAAKKAAWEQKQQQEAEEAALKHQLRMDSIRAIQEERDAAKAREAKLAAEAEAEREAAKAEEAYLKPCWEADTDEYFTAHVQRKMKLNQMTLQGTALLRLAQQQMRQKIEAAYKGVVRDYMDQMELDEKPSVAAHIESAGEAVIQKFVAATKETCRKSTRPDASGEVTVYLSIRVDKKELTDELVNKLSEEEETKIRTNEYKFRQQTAHHFAPVKTQE